MRFVLTIVAQYVEDLEHLSEKRVSVEFVLETLHPLENCLELQSQAGSGL